MACNNEIHENDIGTEFIVTITECVDGVNTPLDISSSTLREIFFLKPNSTKLTFTSPTVVYTPISSGGTGDGTDGKISYFTVAGDLTPAGTYKLQGRVTTPVGEWSSTIGKFKVNKNL